MFGIKLLSAMARVMVSWLDEASSFLGALVRWGGDARKRAVTDELRDSSTAASWRRRLASRLQSSPSRRCAPPDAGPGPLPATSTPHSGLEPATTSSRACRRFSFLGPPSARARIAARLSGDEFAVFLPASASKGRGAGRGTSRRRGSGRDRWRLSRRFEACADFGNRQRRRRGGPAIRLIRGRALRGPPTRPCSKRSGAGRNRVVASGIDS
jgi:GGDEF domain-containing protein